MSMGKSFIEKHLAPIEKNITGHHSSQGLCQSRAVDLDGIVFCGHKPHRGRAASTSQSSGTVMEGLRKKIEAIMSAITFAEEGEFETAKTLLNTRKRGLLAVQNGQMDRKTGTYALNTCKRIGIGLDVLVVGETEREGLAPALKPFLSQLEAESVPFSIVRKTGCIKQAILHYSEAENDILFVVIESQDSLNRNCTTKDKRLAKLWQELKCPLVVVAEGLKA